MGHGHAAAALMVHVCFLLRDRVSNEPKDAAENVLPMLKLFLEMSSNQTAAGVGQGSAASGSAYLSLSVALFLSLSLSRSVRSLNEPALLSIYMCLILPYMCAHAAIKLS